MDQYGRTCQCEWYYWVVVCLPLPLQYQVGRYSYRTVRLHHGLHNSQYCNSTILKYWYSHTACNDNVSSGELETIYIIYI